MRAGTVTGAVPEAMAATEKPADEVDEAAEPAAVREAPSPSAETGALANAGEGNGGGWPDDAAEVAFLAEARGRGELPSRAPAIVDAAEAPPAAPLPPLDDLVRQIPPAVREALDELFRARFVRVVRVPAEALKR